MRTILVSSGPYDAYTRKVTYSFLTTYRNRKIVDNFKECMVRNGATFLGSKATTLAIHLDFTFPIERNNNERNSNS